MPRKPRIERAGKYHVINRGVAQMLVFEEVDDQGYFQHSIVKVLGMAQSMINGIVKRYG